MRPAWNPAKQTGWYLWRNRLVCERFIQGVATSEIAFEFNLSLESVNEILRAFGINQKNGAREENYGG